MRILLCFILAATWAFAQVPPASSPSGTSLTGRVITGEGRDARPVRRARVTLTGPGGQRLADTDTTGVYRFDRVAAGESKITIEKPGFVKLQAAAAPGMTLTMTRGAAIEGIVNDGSGEPLLNVVVSAMHPGPDGKPAVAIQTKTDDLGRYRLHSLAGGEYWVEAATDRSYINRQIVLPGERGPQVNRAYYPSAPTTNEARAVRVAAGTNTEGIDITFVPAAPVPDPAAPPPPPRPEPSGTGRVFGRIVAAGSGKPIAGARILLVGVEGVRLTNWRRSDAQGRFEYTGLAPRHYELTVEADRYVGAEYGQTRPGEKGRPILIKDGESFQADVKLLRGPAIEGTLLDEFGDPAPGVMVVPARKQFASGRHRLMPMGGPQSALVTDDEGHYRIAGLAPGEYFVLALSGAFADQNAVGGFAPTLYPGTTDAAAAIAVAATAGADSISAAFSLAPVKTVSIAGTMVDASGQPVARGTLSLATSDRLKRMEFHVARATTDSNGTFTLRNVPPGMYTLQGFGTPPPGGRGPFNLAAMPFGWLPVSVGDADLDAVMLKVTDGTSLRGRITFDDTTVAPATAREVRVTAMPVEFDSAPVGGGPPPSETRDDLTFEVRHMSGIRRVFVSTSSTQWALKAIMRNGIDVSDEPIDFREKDVEDVEVILTSNVSVVTGTVSDDQRRAVSDYTVIAFPADAAKWYQQSRSLTSARPNQQGEFAIRALPPGDYMIVALPNVSVSEWRDPEFLQMLRPVATNVSLSEGEKKSVSLRVQKRP